MKTIYKYPLDVVDTQPVLMPKDADILCVQTQGERPCLWAIVDTILPDEVRHICIVGTGHPMRDASRTYIDTFQLHGGALVFHVFELLP